MLRAIDELLPNLWTINTGPHRSKDYDLIWEGQRLPPKVVVSRAVHIETGKPFQEGEFSGGQGVGQANTVLSDLGFTIVKKTDSKPALKLDLFRRYSRKVIYATQGMSFSHQNQNLVQGLSPRLKDDGYFIFITLNKENLPPSQAYDDQLFADRFIWVTRRDRGEDHPDYVRLREPGCRVSLFVRTISGEDFAYLGELLYSRHNEFKDPSKGRIQQRYFWTLKNSIPDRLLQELTLGADSPGKAKSGRATRAKSRAPSSFDEMKRAYTYAIDSSERTVIPEHQNFQVRLKRFLESKGIVADMERDFVDVAFSLQGKAFIGEIKVTVNLTIVQAFRTALGQVLDYAHVLYPSPPNMIIFLDDQVDQTRLALATKLDVSVVIENAGKFILKNASVSPPLQSIFSVS